MPQAPRPKRLSRSRPGGSWAYNLPAQLVEQIRSMGLPAAQAGTGTTPRINDIVIRGSLLSINEGSTAERVAIGFGSGASELRTAVEGYQMTARGLRKLGYGTLDASGSKAPGEAVGVAGLIATGNPAGLIISTGMKVYGEESGSSKVEGRAKQTRPGNRRCAQAAIRTTGVDQLSWRPESAVFAVVGLA